MSVLTPTVAGAHFPSSLPKNSMARLVREVRVVCSPYGGCDADLLPVGNVRMPSMPVKVVERIVGVSKDGKEVPIQLKPMPKQ